LLGGTLPTFGQTLLQAGGVALRVTGVAGLRPRLRPAADRLPRRPAD